MTGGGTVIATKINNELVWINVKDRDDVETAIFVEGTPEARCVSEGDEVWWTSTTCLWTPRLKRTLLRGPREVKLVKVGDSAALKPKAKKKSRPLSS